jgi:epoxyqueuosine reductase
MSVERSVRVSSRELQTLIHDAGFDAFAIMPAQPTASMLPILREAQEEDRYPDFVDTDIVKRVDPRNLQESAKSILSLAISYYSGDPSPTPVLHGTISRSAWGLDYHRVLGERMDQVIDGLKQYHGAKECTKAVDTTFLIDRALAIESGLGYPGSNCSVYVPPYGSWVFLGEILVDVDLPTTNARPSENWACPMDCDRCVQACPTGALFAPGKIRPKRCISYLTQMSGPIPLDLREKIGSKLGGCDICQQVCPINRQAKITSHEVFQPTRGPHIPLVPLLRLTKREFVDMFGPTSMAWRGKNVLQRNACVVLGNQRNPEALPILEETAREHPSTVVQDAATWAVKKIKSC